MSRTQLNLTTHHSQSHHRDYQLQARTCQKLKRTSESEPFNTSKHWAPTKLVLKSNKSRNEKNNLNQDITSTQTNQPNQPTTSPTKVAQGATNITNQHISRATNQKKWANLQRHALAEQSWLPIQENPHNRASKAHRIRHNFPTSWNSNPSSTPQDPHHPHRPK